LQHSTLPSESGTLKDTPRTLHQGTFSAIPPTSTASPFDRQDLSSKKTRRSDPMVQHYRSPSTKSGGLEDNEDHKNLCGSTSPRRPLFKAIALLDTKVFVARAMLATKVKVVITLSSMFELSPEPRSSKHELRSRARPPKLELGSSSSSTTKPRVLLSLLGEQTLCLFPFPPSHLLTFSLDS
jgi:hypothetical protein